jgi:hypothetical protein
VVVSLTVGILSEGSTECLVDSKAVSGLEQLLAILVLSGGRYRPFFLIPESAHNDGSILTPVHAVELLGVSGSAFLSRKHQTSYPSQ